MRGNLLRTIGCGLTMLLPVTSHAFEGAPVVGVEAGVAVPTSDFKRSADVGGAIGAFGGYRLSLFGDSFAVSLLGEPMYAAFPTAPCGGDDQRPCRNSEGDLTGIFSLTGGARFALVDRGVEVYFEAKGGYYNATSGAVSGDAGGFNIGGGVSYEFSPGTSLAAFARRDQMYLEAATDSMNDIEFLVFGLGLQHRFEPPPAVEAAPPPPPPTPAPVPVKQKIILRGVHFDFAKADIRADARPVLDEAIATLKENENIAIAINGHTDNIGSAAYNDKLSLRRAEAVFDYLKAGGIDPARGSVFGFGFSNPVASNATADGRAQNRRVELRIVSGD
jgi:outer membrane protein OmpA-like peptidoglycan-associated protein